MNNLENLQVYLLGPYGFNISQVKYDSEDYMPYRAVTHPLHKGKVFRYTPEYAQDMHIFGIGTIDPLPVIKDELIKIFGAEIFNKTMLEKAYHNYTQTKVIVGEDGSVTHISPVGHYTGESIEEFANKLLTDDEFDKEWSLGCTRSLTDDEVIEYFYKHIKPEKKWKRADFDKTRYFYYELKSDMWFEHSGSDILWGMRPECPKRKII